MTDPNYNPHKLLAFLDEIVNEQPDQSLASLALDKPATQEQPQEKPTWSMGMSSLANPEYRTPSMDQSFTDKDNGSLGVFSGIRSAERGAAEFVVAAVQNKLHTIPRSTSKETMTRQMRDLIDDVYRELDTTLSGRTFSYEQYPASTATFAIPFIDADNGKQNHFVVQIGDSRMVIVRDGEIIFRTTDQKVNSEYPEQYFVTLNRISSARAQKNNTEQDDEKRHILSTIQAISDDPSLVDDKGDILDRERVNKILKDAGLSVLDWQRFDWPQDQDNSTVNSAEEIGLKYICQAYRGGQLGQSFGPGRPKPYLDIVPTQPGDLVLAYSDGVNGNLNEAELLKIIQDAHDPTQIAALITEKIKAKWELSDNNNPLAPLQVKKDDVTVVVSEVKKLEAESQDITFSMSDLSRPSKSDAPENPFNHFDFGAFLFNEVNDQRPLTIRGLMQKYGIEEREARHIINKLIELEILNKLDGGYKGKLALDPGIDLPFTFIPDIKKAKENIGFKLYFLDPQKFTELFSRPQAETGAVPKIEDRLAPDQGTLEQVPSLPMEEFVNFLYEELFSDSRILLTTAGLRVKFDISDHDADTIISKLKELGLVNEGNTFIDNKDYGSSIITTQIPNDQSAFDRLFPLSASTFLRRAHHTEYPSPEQGPRQTLLSPEHPQLPLAPGRAKALVHRVTERIGRGLSLKRALIVTALATGVLGGPMLGYYTFFNGEPKPSEQKEKVPIKKEGEGGAKKTAETPQGGRGEVSLEQLKLKPGYKQLEPEVQRGIDLLNKYPTAQGYMEHFLNESDVYVLQKSTTVRGRDLSQAAKKSIYEEIKNLLTPKKLAEYFSYNGMVDSVSSNSTRQEKQIAVACVLEPGQAATQCYVHMPVGYALANFRKAVVQSGNSATAKDNETFEQFYARLREKTLTKIMNTQ